MAEPDSIVVRYWAAARAAAGVERDVLPAAEVRTLADVLVGVRTLAHVLVAVRTLRADRPRLADVVAVCSVLVGDRPVGSAEPGEVTLAAGDTVELVPPFAGG